MGDNDWDLGAVVRSCNINTPNNVVDSSLGSESLTFENGVDWEFLESLLDDEHVDIPFIGSTEFFSREFPVAQQQKLDDQSSSINNSKTPVTIIADEVKIMDQQIILPPQPPPALAPMLAAAPHELFIPQQQLGKPVKVFPTSTMLRTPLVKTRKRKNQTIEIIYELKQEELLDDTWAWRKYGQKPIKTSSFPRNYYRCSTSKGCRAKKHIEKSTEAENLFVVVYSGEHNHPPPTKGSCLSGRSTRDTKLKLPKGINIVPKALKFNSSSSNFSQQNSSDSSISSKTPMLEIENACTNKNEMMTAEKKGDEEEEVVLIPNKFWNEDILKSFEVLNRITCNKFDSST